MFPSSTPVSRRSTLKVAGAFGLAGIVGALTVGPEAGFTQPVVLAALIGGVLLLVAFVLVERRATSPLVPLDTFRVGAFTDVNNAVARLAGLRAVAPNVHPRGGSHGAALGTPPTGVRAA